MLKIKFTLCLRVALLNVTEYSLFFVVHLALHLSIVIKSLLFPSKQKWISKQNTSNNLLWGIFVYKLRNEMMKLEQLINTLCDWLIVQNCPKSFNSSKILQLIVLVSNLVGNCLKDCSFRFRKCFYKTLRCCYYKQYICV